MTDPTGERMVAGRYRLADMLGRGGMGTVWRAYDTVLDRTVAVKEVRVPDDLPDDERARRAARAMREVRAAALVTHPGVVAVYDVVEDGERPWIIMELVPGRTLADDLSEGRLPVSEAARVTRSLLAALAAVHAAGVVHRDIKPGNVLMALDGRAVLTDFGIATLVGSSTITVTGTTIGTLEYMAPERAQGMRPGPASDLWSLGATLYEMLEGRSPFRRNGEFATLQAVLDGVYDPPRHAGELGEVLAGLLTVDPLLRLTADQGLRLLAQSSAAGAAAVTAPVPPSPLPPPPAAVPETELGAAPAAAIPPPPPMPAAPPRVGPQAPDTPEWPTADNWSAPLYAVDPRSSGGELGPGSDTLPVPSRRVRVLVPVLALVLVASGAGVWAYVAGRDGGGSAAKPASATTPPNATSAPGTAPGASAPPSTGPSATSKPGPSATSTAGVPAPPPGPPATSAPPSSAPVPAPAGYHYVDDPGGFRVAVLDGWQRSAEGGRVFYRSPDGTMRLGVRMNAADASGDPYSDLAAQDANGSGSSATATYPGYTRVRLEKTTFGGGPAGIWEFTWNDQGTLRRSVNLRYVANGLTYDFWVSGPEAGTPTIRSVFEAAKSTFTPRS
ncbi:serine/threonine-protein kinase [Yinghuangia soli]|uniref:non-specific serine/threonine protein kinase n=1 Tax=Yinghuangia soli TaxID=2908204 RepID=A0AA41Q2M5_9ACTN|nr:serine/threonine-protein kinase [Yinghuangia soli]MCF2530077.1 serine/threonine protein kinase [Yinghuangia soli]